MEQIKEFFEKSRSINLLLILVSFGIYFFYFHHIFLNINSLLSSITADSLKNYYTYVYHIKNDTTFLNFSGMNYPYGEHIIYTDCQPILTFILRLLPVTQNYLIGIMHGLIFFSFIISPLILNKILKLLNIDKFSSFFISLAIAFLSPQFLKINAGHFALAYGCIIPLSILFTLNYLKEKNRKNLLILLIFNTLLFLLHPYLGFCLCLFSFIALFSFELVNFQKKIIFKNSLFVAIATLLPLALFKVFMLLTDHHTDRTLEPYGADMMVENLDSILAPVFGPFQNFMEYFFLNRTAHYEGHTYLGFFTILLFLLFVIALPFVFKKIKVAKEVLVLAMAGLFFLLIAFGVHLKILNLLHMQSPTLSQFRAVCRFAWIFYFTLPLFLITVLYHSLRSVLKPAAFTRASMTVALFFFGFNFIEAHSYFRLDKQVFWKFRNFFNENNLNAEEKTVLENLRDSAPQGILPLPLFHGGSEMYGRTGSDNSMVPSMIYSFHSNTPILSVLMSRTSLTETKDLIQLLNSYKKEKPIENILSQKDFFVLTTKDPLMPDETRLLPYIKQFGQNDSLQFGYINMTDLLRQKKGNDIQVLESGKAQLPDSSDLIYIPYENRKPFLPSNILDYETIFTLDSNKVSSDVYVVSFHYHYKKSTYQALASNLIINRVSATNAEWQYNIPVRYLSGFYNGFGIFEYRILLGKENKYDFMLKGFDNSSYSISHFMLRKEKKNVLIINSKRDTTLNNFPL